MAEQLSNFGQSTLTSPMTDSATTADVVDGSVYPSIGNYRVNINDELMIVTSRSSNSLTVTRGAEDTTAVAHTAGQYVTQVITAEGFEALIGDRTVATKLYMYNSFK